MRKISILAFSTILLFLFLKGFVSLLSSNFSMNGIVVLGSCLLPAFFIVCIMTQRWWLGVLIGGTVWQHYIPFSFIGSFEIGIIMTVVIAALIVAQTAYKKQLWVTAINSWQSKVMILVTVWILIRVIIDNPGSIHAGEAGGAKEAYTFLLGGIVFFLPKFIYDIKPNIKLTRRVVEVLVILALVVHIFFVFSEGIAQGVMSLFVRSVWFLCAYLLASIAERSWRLGYNNLKSSVMVGVTLILGALSAHRSRFLFAAGIIFIVSYIYGRLSRNMMFIIVIGIGLASLLYISGSELPAPVSRSLSIIFPSHATKAREYIQINELSNEVGWESPFRKTLLQMATANIRNKPLLGKGFRFSVNDYWIPYHKRNTMEGQYQVLASTGAYHNSLLELAVAYGIPVIILFCIAYLGVVIPFIKNLRLSDVADVRILFTGILGLFIAESGQVLMNGGAQDFYVISLLMGIMHYSTPILGLKSDVEGM